MGSKKSKFLKFSIFVGLTLIAVSIVLFGGVNKLPEKDDYKNNHTVVKHTFVGPTIIQVSLRDSIVDFGIDLLGTPYVSGACGTDGFDCSGFVYFVYQHFNIKVPRSSIQYKNFGKEVSIDSLKKGDILVFLSPTRNVIGHVGIVTNPKGTETDFIHASSGGEMKVMISSLKQGHYMKRFVKAVNVLGDL